MGGKIFSDGGVNNRWEMWGYGGAVDMRIWGHRDMGIIPNGGDPSNQRIVPSSNSRVSGGGSRGRMSSDMVYVPIQLHMQL